MSGHRILIDWISFTFDVDWHGASRDWTITRQLVKAVEEMLGWTSEALGENITSWEYGSGRAPYNASYRSPEGIYIWYNARIGHALMEITGRGCDWLRQHGLLESLIMRVKDRVTRIDLAVDMLTDTTPAQFVSSGSSGRFKSRGHIQSETGETVYLGSQKSERYCRVYRYAEPHPRAKFLRAEMVFKKQNAKLFCASMIESKFNYTALALGAGQVYGFEHDAWDLRGDEIPLTSYTPERRSGKTVMWLISQVAPAFKKLVAEGVIENPEQFISEYFLSE